MKKRYSVTIGILLGLVCIAFALVANSGFQGKINYGVTFSVPYAQSLGLPWKEVFDSMLSDLGVKNIRIPVYWDEVENQQGVYDFSDTDYMLQEAAQDHASVILAIGKRLPRWPECHEPDWAQKLSSSDEQNDQLSYMETVMRRYASNTSVIAWQVENEPFVSSFGPCPKLDTAFFDQEIAFVKNLDPSRPVLVTDSGELSDWLPAGSRGDLFGTTFYRYVYSDVLKRYWTNFYIPVWWYRLKGGLVRLLNHQKPIMIAELQAEPWTTNGITSTPIAEQFETMSLDHFKAIASLAKSTGYSPQYLWGVEWWYYMKQQGHPEFWEYAKTIFNQ